MRKTVNLTLIFSSIALFIGCGDPQPAPSTCGKGAYCYKNINFGPSRGRSFEQGIADGCRTGEGHFRKDYYKSSHDKNYADGWILGRSKCRQILPNEGTLLEQQHSKQRAEYQIRQMQMQQEAQPDPESMVDAILNATDNNTEQIQDIEY